MEIQNPLARLVATLFGSGTTVSRVVYILVGLAALWGLAMFRHGSARDGR